MNRTPVARGRSTKCVLILTVTVSILCFSALSCAAATALDDQLLPLAKEVSSRLRGTEVQRLSIEDFVSLTGGQTTVAKYITELFKGHLMSQEKKFQIIDRSSQSAIIAELAAQRRQVESREMDETTAAKTGKRRGVDVVLTGSVTVLSSSVLLTIQVTDVETAELFVSLNGNIKIPQLVGQASLVGMAPEALLDILLQPPSVEEQPTANIELDDTQRAAASIVGCPNGTVWVSTDGSGNRWGRSYARVRIVNLHSLPIDISDESQKLVRNLCPGGSVSLFREVQGFLKEGTFEYQYFATGKFSDGSSGKMQSPIISLPINKPTKQFLTWQVQLQKAATPR